MKKFLLSILVIMFSIVPMFSTSVAFAEEKPVNLATSKVESGAYDFMKDFVTNEDNSVSDYALRQRNRVEYLSEVILAMGYEVSESNFQKVKYANKFNRDANEEAFNLIVTKKAASDSKKKVVISANYDNAEGLVESIQNSDGASSNGTGVGVMLQLMKEIKDSNLNVNVEFVFFSASEVGLKGSRYYVAEMSKEEQDNLLLAVNLWNVGAGDNTYIYDDEMHWSHYEYIQNVAKDNNISIMPMPFDKKVLAAYEENIGLEYNHQALLSDIAPFVAKRLPTISIFSGNFTNMGYVQSAQYGTLMATKNDTIKKFDEIFGDKGKTKMNETVDLLKAVVTDSVLEQIMVKSINSKPDYSFFTLNNNGITIVTWVVTGVILLGMILTYVLLKNKAEKSNDPIKPLYIDLNIVNQNGEVNNNNDVNSAPHEDPFGLDDESNDNSNNSNNNNKDNPFGI